METKFKENAMNILKGSLEISDLEAINLLLDGKSKVNSFKKSHLEAFRTRLKGFSLKIARGLEFLF